MHLNCSGVDIPPPLRPTDAATEACAAEEGQTMYVVEMRAVAARADRPVKVTEL